MGSAADFSTYLSPITHHGSHWALNCNVARAAAFNPQAYIMEYGAEIAMDFMQNKQHTSSMTDIDFNLHYTLQRRFHPLSALQLSAGAGLEFDAGALYLPRNSNNPVAARVSLFLTLGAQAAYSFTLGKTALRIIDSVSLPSLGAFFSPQFGESYYEIYLGNDHSNAYCGWWGNHFTLANTLKAQIRLHNTWLALGYKYQYRSSYVNQINTRLVSHSALISVSGDWLNVTRSTPSPQAKTITAIY